MDLGGKFHRMGDGSQLLGGRRWEVGNFKTKGQFSFPRESREVSVERGITNYY